MAWYDDDRKESHTQRYANAELAAQDAHRAAAKGWQEQSRMTARAWPQHGPLVVRAGFDTFDFQPGEVELIFGRTEEWLEQHRKVSDMLRHRAWYDDERKESHSQRYPNAELAAQDAHRAEAKGWQVLPPTTAGGPPTQGPFVVGAGSLTFGYQPGAFDDQPGEVELTFTRTEEWLEQHRTL